MGYYIIELGDGWYSMFAAVKEVSLSKYIFNLIYF